MFKLLRPGGAARDGAISPSGSASRQNFLRSWFKKAEKRSFEALDDSNRNPKICWRPITLQPVVLLTVIAFTVAIIVAIQVLRHYTTSDNGLAFASAGSTTFSAFTTFGYLYFPTIIAVFFSMLWSWIDLDVKRLEPFHQMAVVQGATVGNSLLLRYPFDYVALVPIQAARRRHWSVFISGTITVLIFWAITPLQNSMISTSQVERILTTNASVVENLTTIGAQLPDLDLDLLQNAWATLWYNQSLPAFTTNTSSFTPFVFDQRIQDDFPGATITGDSSRFWTTFNCEEGHFTFSGGNETYGPAFEVVDNQGCEINLSIFDTRQIYCGQVGSSADSNDKCSFSRSGQNCGDSNHTLLIGLAKGQWGLESDLTNGSVTAKFCNMQYWKQQGRLTVHMDDLSFSDFQASQEPSLLDPRDFDTSEFEAILATDTNKHGARYGYTNQSMTDGTGNATSINMLEQWAHFGSDDIHPDSRPTFAFMYQLMNADPGQVPSYADASWMATGFERTHQLLFALAMGAILAKSLQPDAEMTLTITTQSTAVVLVDPLALIVQVFLGMLALLALLLLISSCRKPTNLDADPDSLARIATLLEPDSTTAIALSSLHRGVGMGISGNARFRLKSENFGSRIVVEDDNSSLDGLRIQKEAKTAQLPAKRLPFHLSYICGFLFVVILGSAIGLIALLQNYSLAGDGIPLPSENQVVQQLVLNYAPIVFATFVEPFWTLLNRSLCLLQPFSELNTLKASARVSVDTRYSALPPQVVFLRAMKNRHWFLASICLVAISSNILAVTMGALFNIQQIQEERWVSASAPSQALFNDTESVGLVPLALNQSWIRPQQTFQDHFYIVQSNITRGTNLPPWTASDFFFMPQEFDTSPASSFTVSTIGFGVRTSCQDLAPQISSGAITPMNNPVDGEYAKQAYHIGLKGMFDDGNATFNCTTPTKQYSQQVFALINGTAALENFDVLIDVAEDTPMVKRQNESASTMVSPCLDMFIVTYSRTDNASALPALAANAVGAAAPAPTHTFPAGAEGPCHQAGCRNERKRQEPFYSSTTQAQPMNIVSQTNLVCKTTIVTGNFSVTVDSFGTVQAYTQSGELSEDVSAHFKTEHDRRELIARLNSLATGMDVGGLSSGTTTGRAVWHNATVARQWFPYLMMLATGNSSTVDASLPAPPAEELMPIVSNMSAFLGSIVLSLYQDRLLPFKSSINGTQSATAPPEGRAAYQVPVSRVFLDPTMYVMTIVLLSVHMVAAVVFYFSIPRDVLERLPTTLAEQLGFFEGSTLIEERDWDPKWKYGYGRFVGADGRPRIGIERVPLVQPLDINRKVSWLQAWRKS